MFDNYLKGLIKYTELLPQNLLHYCIRRSQSFTQWKQYLPVGLNEAEIITFLIDS